MDEERVILVDRDDNIVGSATKRESHIVANIRAGMLHRAFSVFLFNSQGLLCLQQRAHCKITFPLVWTNTCCSHPLHTSDGSEMDPSDLQIGAKRAAIRKLDHELGIPLGSISTDDFQLITRIHYIADSDEQWGEHEIDYVMFVQKDVTLQPNPNEVESIQWVDRDGLRSIIARSKAGELKMSPWCALMCEEFVFKWWDAMEAGTLKDCYDWSQVHRLGQGV